ncbi:MAG: head decoration protein [Deltaproteobacteria bacterium]|nr:head decoration protein [Deltaproteobacteria bacterium]
MTVLTESKHIGDVVIQEADRYRSRDQVIVLAGDGAERALAIGEVIGKITHGTPTVEADEGNTGDGVMGAVTLGALAELGDYVLTCIEAVEDGGVFQLTSPLGYTMPPLTVGVAYAGDHLNMTLAVGDTDFVAGDKITISVPAGFGKVVALAPAAVDGSQNAAGLMAAAVTAPDGSDAPGVAIRREAAVKLGGLTWPDAITDDQKTAALAQLAALSIIARQEV